MYGRRKTTTRPATELTEERRDDLLGNIHGFVGGPGDAFATEAERRACWEAHGDRLMRAVNSGCRPAGWWAFSSTVALDIHRGQAEQLYVLGALTPAERREFEAWCHRLGRRLEDLPPPGYRAPDPRTAA